MINKYKKISIIYGGSGVECARKIDSEINRMHEELMYPIQSAVIANQILGGSNIFQSVKNAISDSDLCIIILTFDDVNNTRIRQNVLIELGMALMTIQNTENCIFLTERFPLPDDFPSDLKGWINPNYFKKDQLDEIASKVCEEVRHLLKSKSHKKILSAETYLYNHETILDDIPNNVFEEKSDIQLEHILECWKGNIASFDFVSERIMYLAERLKFFPDFNCNDKFFAFLNDIKNLIQPTEKDYETFNIGYINTACALIEAIIDYTDLKLRKNVIVRMNAPDANRAEANEYLHMFDDIVYRIQKFINKIEKYPDIYQYNWLLHIIAYEYIALAQMKAINLTNTYTPEEIETLRHVIACYNKMIEIAELFGGPSENLWLGYAQYDLTRAYEALYRITDDQNLLEKIRYYSISSITTRRKWCKVNTFKGVFTNALSFEYFLVKKHELEIRLTTNGYANITKEQMVQDLKNLDEELKQYCDSTELGRLYDMKSSIDELHKLIT